MVWALAILCLTTIAVAEWRMNIGSFQRDTPGEDYMNIGSYQTDESAAPVEEATTGAQVIVIIQM